SRGQQHFDLALSAIKLLRGFPQDPRMREAEFGRLRGKLHHVVAGYANDLEDLLKRPDDGVSRAALASDFDQLGDLTGALGDKDAAVSAFKGAVALRRDLAERDRADPSLRLDLADSLLAYGLAEVELNDFKGARGAYEEARDLAAPLVESGRQ